eukprot:32220-Prorocentrum_minimum.AAC.1
MAACAGLGYARLPSADDHNRIRQQKSLHRVFRRGLVQVVHLRFDPHPSLGGERDGGGQEG